MDDHYGLKIKNIKEILSGFRFELTDSAQDKKYLKLIYVVEK